jgi:hypothetical protein
MSAEQLWDSLLTLVVPDLEGTLRPPGARAEEVYARYERFTADTPPADLAREIEAVVLRQTDPARFREMMRERAAAQAQQRQADSEANLQRARPLFRDLAVARRRNDAAAEAKVLAELRALGVPIPGERGRRQRPEPALGRASDLPAPAPVGHLLREFGQSDRETVEAAHTAASVPQVLDLLNGFVDQRLVQNRGSVLRRAIDAEKTAAGKVETAYLALLGRKPTAAEARAWRPEDGAKAADALVGDLIWVLVNSHEFRFIR